MKGLLSRQPGNEFAQVVTMGEGFSVGQEGETRSAVVAGAVAVPQNCQHVTMITGAIEAEPVPGVFRQERLDFDSIIVPRADADQAGD